VDEFYTTFNIKPGSPMYRADSLRVRIWWSYFLKNTDKNVRFWNIDDIIKFFRKGKFGIFISNKTKSDWCQFEYRGIEWKNNDIIHLVEIFPELKEDCSYEKWHLSVISYYDERLRRYSLKNKVLNEVSFEELNQNFEDLFLSLYSDLNNLSRKDLSEFIILKTT
jgi:hypothetical protein